MAISEEEVPLMEDGSPWPYIRAIVTCHTEGCPAAGIGYLVTLYQNLVGDPYRSFCGACETYNHDIEELSE